MLTKSDQAWMLHQAAFRLRALGRQIEAPEAFQAALQMAAKLAEWKNAASGAGNLSELELTLGEIPRAVSHAEQSVAYADLSGDALVRMISRTIRADALHQAGRQPEADARFREAEEMQAKRDPGRPLLYSTGSYVYCDLLLATAERAAWQQYIQGSAGLKPAGSGTMSDIHQPAENPDALYSPEDSTPSATQEVRRNGQAIRALQIQSCRDVVERTALVRHWGVSYYKFKPLDIALIHLTLGRAALYQAILEGSSPNPCNLFLKKAVDGLRLAGQQDHRPRSLLTRAWLRSLSGAHTGPESAQSDLDEAWEIAERGPMPLFLGDIHLHRARLFGPPALKAIGEKYPWESPAADLAAARRLIEKHGYLRRMKELEDAEAAARNWAGQTE